MKKTVALLLLSIPLAARLQAQVPVAERVEVPGEIVVCFDSDDASLDLDAVVAQWGLQSADASFHVAETRSLLHWQRRGETKFTNVVLIEYSPPGLDSSILQRQLATIEGVCWASPNVKLTGDPRELVPDDPQYGSQYHHPLMQNDDAWDITLGDSSVIMGITDDGVDIDHADLIENIWTNPGEIPGDGTDNDGNGYVDDVHGWDFVFDNNDPNPNSGDGHGTHVAGIAGARTNNSTGVAGTAGRATIMPLQFYSSSMSWTAADIAESFAYGVDNGALILSTSYNINGWVGDPTVTAAFDYIYDQGALHFNSAGNGAELNPARQAFHQTMLVASTDASDVMSSFSNYGTGIDLAAPGSSILSTLVGGGYGTNSGTSMAAPNAAGVAALIWSANLTWTRDQVAAQIYFTADNIDAQNPGLEGLLGGGRVNAYNAVTATLPAPQVTQADGLPNEGGALIGDLTSFKVRFDQIMAPGTINVAGAFRLVYAGADGVFGTGDDAPIALSWDEYLISSNEVSFHGVGAFPGAGDYRVTADASVLANPFFTALDGNGDGNPGDSWSRTFSACSAQVLLEDLAESGVDWSVVNVSLSTGAWTVPPEVPIGGGTRNDPPTDYDGSGKCFLTQNAPGDTDVDGGPTRLISRAYDITITPDPYLSFARWLVTTGTDIMVVDISTDDGASWTNVDALAGTDGWEVETFRVSDYVTPTAQTRLRFSVEDADPPSITEAAIDWLRIIAVVCDNPPAVGTSYCTTAPNSVGMGALIRATGSAVVADNDFTLITEHLPVGEFGLYYFGPDQIQLPFGDGYRCVGGAIIRILPPGLTDSFGQFHRTVDLTAPPAAGNIVPGASLNFQFWYRDPGAGTAGFNLSDGLHVDWM